MLRGNNCQILPSSIMLGIIKKQTQLSHITKYIYLNVPQQGKEVNEYKKITMYIFCWSFWINIVVVMQ